MRARRAWLAGRLRLPGMWPLRTPARGSGAAPAKRGAGRASTTCSPPPPPPASARMAARSRTRCACALLARSHAPHHPLEPHTQRRTWVRHAWGVPPGGASDVPAGRPSIACCLTWRLM